MFNFIVSGIISLDESTAFVVPDTLQVDTYWDDYDVWVAYYSSVETDQSLELYFWDIEEIADEGKGDDVDDLSQTDVFLDIDLADLEEPYS